MDLPQEKHSGTPITGRSSKQAEVPAGIKSPGNPADSGEGVDLKLGDEIFERPVISLPPRVAPKEPPKAGGRDVNPPPPEVKEGETPVRRKNPLGRGELKAPNFKRLISRPQTTIAANIAASQSRAESPVSLDRVEQDSMRFGKIHPHAVPDYRPNRLFRVLDSIYTHSPLRWLDAIERTGMRFIVVTILMLIVGGFVAWKYFLSLGGRDTDSSTEEVRLTIEERMDQGKKAVQEFLSGQTVQARLPWVMDPERAAPRMKEYYETMGGQDPKVLKWEVGEPRAGDHGAWLPLTFEDSAGNTVTIAMEETKDGARVDWENFVSFGEANWQEYCRTRPTAPKTMRVRLRRVDKYEGTYTRQNWQSYEIEHRSGTPRLLGYAARTERTGQALADIAKDEKWQAANLYLRFEATSGGNNLVVIDEVVRSRWQDEAVSWAGP